MILDVVSRRVLFKACFEELTLAERVEVMTLFHSLSLQQNGLVYHFRDIPHYDRVYTLMKEYFDYFTSLHYNQFAEMQSFLQEYTMVKDKLNAKQQKRLHAISTGKVQEKLA